MYVVNIAVVLSLSLIQLQPPKDRKIFDTSHYPESKCSLEAESIKSDNLRSLLVSEVTIELPLQVYPNFIVESDQSQSDLILGSKLLLWSVIRV